MWRLTHLRQAGFRPSHYSGYAFSVLRHQEESSTGLLTLDRAFLQLVHAFNVTDPGAFRFLDIELLSRVLVLADDVCGLVELEESLASPAVEIWPEVSETMTSKWAGFFSQRRADSCNDRFSCPRCQIILLWPEAYIFAMLRHVHYAGVCEQGDLIVVKERVGFSTCR